MARLIDLQLNEAIRTFLIAGREVFLLYLSVVLSILFYVVVVT